MSGMYPQSSAYSDSQLWSLAAFIHRIRDLPPGVADAIRIEFFGDLNSRLLDVEEARAAVAKEVPA